MLHSIFGWFNVGLGWFVNSYSSHSIHGGQGSGSNHSIHRTKEVGSRHKGVWFLGCKGVSSCDARVYVPMIQGDGFASKLGRIVEVIMWLCTPLLVGF